MIIEKLKKKSTGNVIDHKNLKKIKNKKISGVYFLFKQGSLIYIGQSTDVESRIVQHRKDKVFDTYSFKRIKQYRLIDVEKECIKYYNPPLNNTYTDKALNKSNNDIDVPINTAILLGSTLYINLKGKQHFSEVLFFKKKSGVGYYEFKDLKGEIMSNGSALLKNFDFRINIFGGHYFMSNRDGTYTLRQDLDTPKI
jgi:hypothetical protein